MKKGFNPPTRTYLGGPKAMDTPMDIKELPSGIIVLTVDMPGVNPNEINVQVEDGTVLRKFPRFNLVISGERKRTEEDKEGKYLMMERTMGTFVRKFQLPESANMETIAAWYQDGVLTVTVEKKPLPAEPKKPRTVEVKVDYFRG